MQIDFGADDDISFTKEGRAGLIKLTRPSALNALNQRMVSALKKLSEHGKQMIMFLVS